MKKGANMRRRWQNSQQFLAVASCSKSDPLAASCVLLLLLLLIYWPIGLQSLLVDSFWSLRPPKASAKFFREEAPKQDALHSKGTTRRFAHATSANKCTRI